MADPEAGASATEETTHAATGDAGQQEISTDAGVQAGTTAEQQSVEGSEESFFDPNSVPEELLPAYKQMQRAFTKKSQAIRESKDKVAAYDSFMADPRGNLERLASQYGLTLAQAAAAQAQSNEQWEPQTWDEVTEKIKSKLLSDLQPVLGEIEQVKRSNVERMLDDEVPEWREHEDEMIGLMQKHPTLAQDPAMLARLAIPQQQLESKAMQAALRKLEDKGRAAQVSAGSKTTKEPQTQPKSKPTFAEAVEAAKRQVAAGQGIAG